MRKLTFAGFTKQYVAALSGIDTTSVYQLTREAVQANPRLREPLLLYAISNGKANTLLSASKNTPLFPEYVHMIDLYPYPALLSALEKKEDSLAEGYQKVWRSYVSIANTQARDNRVKELLRQRILRIQEEKSVSTYRLCKELSLNNANVNAWLKHASPGEVSLNTARRMLSCLEAMP